MADNNHDNKHQKPHKPHKHHKPHPHPYKHEDSIIPQDHIDAADPTGGQAMPQDQATTKLAMPPTAPAQSWESHKLEAVIVCVNFDDMLDVTLPMNHPHVDNMVIVTSHQDTKTQAVAKKYGATCVLTDLFSKNTRKFNKGAAINAGFGYFQYKGWRMHLDADIVLPDNFRRMMFNHTTLNESTIYGADRVNVVGLQELWDVRANPQAAERCLVHSNTNHPHEHRYVDPVEGYLPIGYFQMWHASCQKPYPFSLGDASHDDAMFAALWPRGYRQLLPSAICYHLVAQPPTWGENWDGERRHPRLSD